MERTRRTRHGHEKSTRGIKHPRDDMSRERRLGHGLGHVCELDGGLPSAVADAAEVRAGIRGVVRASRTGTAPRACLTGPRLPALLPARLPAGPGGANGGAAVSGAVGRALAHLARPHLPHLAAISAHLAAISPHLRAEIGAEARLARTLQRPLTLVLVLLPAVLLVLVLVVLLLVLVLLLLLLLALVLTRAALHRPRLTC